MTLALAMIVKNEDHIIGECLSSVRGLVDEIVVVDTGSTDHTKVIALSVGAKVFDFPWCDDFAKARNESLKHCDSDWILILDADEAIDISDHARIREAINSDCSAFYTPIWNYLPSKDIVVMERSPKDNPNFEKEMIGGMFPYYAQHEGMRLFRNVKEPVFVGKIHETPDDYFREKGLETKDLDIIIHHFGKMIFDREHSKIDYYLNMAQEDAAANPNSRTWFNVFQQALVANKPELVLKAAKEYMQIHNGAAAPIVFIGCGMALRELGRIEDSLVCFDAVLKQDPKNIIALKQKELSLFEMKN